MFSRMAGSENPGVPDTCAHLLPPHRPSSAVEGSQTSMWSCAGREDQAPKASRA